MINEDQTETHCDERENEKYRLPGLEAKNEPSDKEEMIIPDVLSHEVSTDVKIEQDCSDEKTEINFESIYLPEFKIKNEPLDVEDTHIPHFIPCEVSTDQEIVQNCLDEKPDVKIEKICVVDTKVTSSSSQTDLQRQTEEDVFCTQGQDSSEGNTVLDKHYSTSQELVDRNNQDIKVSNKQQQTRHLLSCNDCKKTFESRSASTYHTQTHLGIETFQGMSQLANHEPIYERADQFSCPECNKCFGNKAYLPIHTKLVHEKIKSSCSVCNKTFFNKGSLIKHEATHLDRKSFTCLICNKSFTIWQSFVKHQRRVHTEVRAFSCDVCAMSFKTRNHLNRHLLTHSGIKKFSCEKCDRKFSNKNVLKEHQDMHLGVKPHSCSFCGKQFTFSSNKAKHEKTHSAERKKFTCQSCGNTYLSKHALVKHSRICASTSI